MGPTLAACRERLGELMSQGNNVGRRTVSAVSRDRNGYLQNLKSRRAAPLLGLLGVLAAALAFPLSAFASDGADALDPFGGSAPLAAGPSIASHKADYAPGESVILTGAGWQPGEPVRIVVDDDGVAEQRWQHDVTVTADETGAVSEQFLLPAYFVADYSVTATGEQSGTATTTFTDAVQTVTSLTQSVNPSDINKAVTFTATVRCFTAGSCSTLQANPVDFVENGGGQDHCNNGTSLGSVTPTGSDPKNVVTASVIRSFATSVTRIVAACYQGGGSNPAPGASAASVTHDVNAGAPAKLVFTAAPTATDADDDINGATGVKVTVQDKDGTTTSNANTSVTLALGSTPGGGALSGRKTVPAVNGVATFTGLSIDKAANGYTLAASSPGLPVATSTPFDITKRASTTDVACFPNPTALNQPTTCTATVSDTSAGNATAPTGNVTWTKSGTGTLGSTSCTLNGSGSSASCSVTYTPTSGSKHDLTADYAGDVKHNAASDGKESVTINSLSASTLSVDAASGTLGGTTTLSASLKKSDGTALGGKTVSFRLNGGSVVTATTNASGVATTAGVSLAGIAVGTYTGAVVATFNGDGTANGSTGSNKLTVNPNCTAPTVTTNPQDASITYGADAAFTAAGTGNPAPAVQWQVKTGATWADISSQTGSTLTLSKPAVSQSGEQYRAVYSSSCGGTPTATSNAATLTVAKKSITGTFTAADKVYDGNTNATVTGRDLAGVVGQDKVSLSGNSAKFDSRNVGDRTVTLADAELAGEDKGNYTLTSVATAAAKITRLGVTGTFKAADKVYDGDVKAVAGGRELVGAVKDDKVSLSGGTATFDSKNVGDR